MRRAVFHLSVAMTCWLALSVSIGWYYTVTYFGRVGWPMPSVETVGALLLYYFSVLNVATEIQAVHWVLVFPLAGLFWVGALRWIARTQEGRPAFALLAMRLAVSSLPLSLPLPYMVLVAGETETGWALQRMLDVALRRGNVSPWPWLSPMYFALGTLAFIWHLRVLRTSFPAPLGAFARQTLLAGVLFVLAVAVTGSLASYPLRAWLE